MPAKTECYCCGHKDWKKYLIPLTVYNNPFEDESEEIWICGDCDSNGYINDSYEFCDQCNRYIAVSNGYRNYIRYSEEGGIQCVDCVQEDWFKNGMSKETFEKPGLAIDGDFFNREELESCGYHKDSSYSYGAGYTSWNGYDGIAKCKAKALELIEQGKKVIIDIDSSGMGLGGYFSLWST